MRSPVVWLAVVEPRRVESRTLSEPESKALVAAYGVPVPSEATAMNAAEAADAADRVGYPVVLKLAGGSIAHKPSEAWCGWVSEPGPTPRLPQLNCLHWPGPTMAGWNCWWHPWSRVTGN